MNTKFPKIIGCVVLLAVVGGAFFAVRIAAQNRVDTTAAASVEQTLYTCGMHPQVIQDHPGNCPICGMKLTPIRKQGSPSASAGGERKVKYYKSTMNPGETSPTPRKDSMGMDMVPAYEEGNAGASTITVDSGTEQNMNLRTGVVMRGPLRRTIRTVGTVDFDEAALADVTTKFKGWIEKLYVDYTGRQVHHGDPLFEVYSPELYSAQTEYVLAMNGASGKGGVGADLIKASALAKLKYFDVSDDQIAELEKTREVKKTLRVSAPRDGIVVEKMVVEGQMVDAGMKLYRLADLGLVWVLSQIYEQDLPYIKLGQEAVVSLSYLSDRKFRGRVTYIYPTVDEKTRTARVRMEFHNPGFFLKPGMFATVEVQAELEPSALLVPDSAVLRSGEKNTVFVALDGGRFDPRTVTLGPRGEGNFYQVLNGLNEGDRVVTSGQFLLDSESQLREAIEKMRSPSSAVVAGEPASVEVKQAATNALESATPAEPEKLIYICPMPEHLSIVYQQPGKCPLCGMMLIPVTEKTLEKLRPGGRVAYYTCPMTDNCPTPGHAAVKYDKPGKCPICGMTLIPVMEPIPAPSGASERGERGSVLAPSTPNAPNAPRSTTLYTCPMASHADVVSDKPGECPKCGMQLVETSTVPHGKIAEENWRKQHTLEHQH